MRIRRFLLVLIGLVFACLFLSCVPKNAKSDFDYQQDPEKAIIKKRLLDAEKAWNARDTEGVLSFFTEDAQIMVGSEQKIVNKPAYAAMFPEIFDRTGGKAEYESLLVQLVNSKLAKVEGVLLIPVSQGTIWLYKDMSLVKQNGQWLIKKSFFEHQFEKNY